MVRKVQLNRPLRIPRNIRELFLQCSAEDKRFTEFLQNFQIRLIITNFTLIFTSFLRDTSLHHHLTPPVCVLYAIRYYFVFCC